MAAPRLTLSDLARDLGEVARGLPSWRRGEPDEAARETLEHAAGALHRKPPALWAWTGRTMGGEPAVALPVRVPQAIAFAPEPHARTLVGARRGRRRRRRRRGAPAGGVARVGGLVAPGMDAELFGLALSDAVGDGWRVAVAAVPEEAALGDRSCCCRPHAGLAAAG